MKIKTAVVSLVASLAFVAMAPAANAQTEPPNLVGGLAAAMGLLCNTVDVLGLPLCHQ